MEYRVREIRKQLGITQTELCKRSGVSREIVSGLELGTSRTTTIATLDKIANALGVRISDLFFEDEIQHIGKEKT